MTTSTCSTHAMVVGVLVEHRYLAQAEPAGVVAALGARGVDVRLLVAEHEASGLCDLAWWDRFDVVLARGRSLAVLALLRTAEQAGVPLMSTAASVLTVVDKAGMTATLAAGRVPTPTTWLGHPSALARRADVTFPLVLKPITGDNARGLQVVRDRSSLAGLSWPDPVAIAQAWHRGDGVDLKLYVAGDHVWAVRRPSPVARDGTPREVRGAGSPVEVDAEMRRVAQQCRRLFGMSWIGIDCLQTAAGLLVVEVNDFPTYRGVPQADEALADLVVTRARRRPAPLRRSPVGAAR